MVAENNVIYFFLCTILYAIFRTILVNKLLWCYSGLVHKTQMSSARIDEPGEMVDEGEEVYCKVISVEDDKIALSMKVVNQSSGQDLDENNVQIK